VQACPEFLGEEGGDRPVLFDPRPARQQRGADAQPEMCLTAGRGPRMAGVKVGFVLDDQHVRRELFLKEPLHPPPPAEVFLRH